MKNYRLIFLLLLALLTACQSGPSTDSSVLPSEVATLSHPAQSPSGQYQLQLQENEKDGQKQLSFQILDASGKVIFISSDQFSTRNKTYFLWDAQDRVWVSTGSTAIYYWHFENQQWVRFDALQTHEPLPDFLKQALPVQH